MKQDSQGQCPSFSKKIKGETGPVDERAIAFFSKVNKVFEDNDPALNS